MENAAPPLKGLLEELQSKFNGSFYTASAVPPSEEMREVKRRGGMLHTAPLTVDEMDSCWRCHQEIKDSLLNSRTKGLFQRFALLPITTNRL